MIKPKFVVTLVAGISICALSSCAHGPKPRTPLVSNSAYGELTELRSPADVVVIPQWHLSPNEDTQANPRPKLPQSLNQISIYNQLVEWVDAGQIKSVVVEGCEGEITEDSPLKFNGWTVQTLKSLSEDDRNSTLTQMGLKLKAHYGPKLPVLCGDDLALIQKHQLLLSDMRGFIGFKIRINEFKNQPLKRKDYVATVRELLKLRPETTDDQVITALNQELQSKVDQFETIVKERNQRFVAASAPRSAVVIGALHVADLSQQLRASGKTVVTFRPLGLEGGESELINQIRQLLKEN
ncbi:MAG: hypothetical protein EOP05_05410 [Proteobacteria bacterium]|nr:MAG: hypothetical protein EOP05_05410 [Pseudomonadota bacterium]